MSDAPQSEPEPNAAGAKTTVPVVIFADFVCPYSYIAQEQVNQLVEEYDVEPLWRPHWLHPDTPPEGNAIEVDPERRKATTQWLRDMAPEMAERMRPQERMQYSFNAFQAMQFAEQHDRSFALNGAIFEALWAEGKDIGRIATLQECGARAGLDADALGKALFQGTYAPQTMLAVTHARVAGVCQTPTTVLGEMAIIGWHYYEVYQSVMEQQGIVPRAGREAQVTPPA